MEGDNYEKGSCSSRCCTAGSERDADRHSGEAHLSGRVRYRSVGSLRPLYGEVHRHRGDRHRRYEQPHRQASGGYNQENRWLLCHRDPAVGSAELID